MSVTATHVNRFVLTQLEVISVAVALDIHGMEIIVKVYSVLCMYVCVYVCIIIDFSNWYIKDDNKYQDFFKCCCDLHPKQ